MYGIINKAIEGLVTENFGSEKWDQIKVQSGIKEDRFLSNDHYEDATTYQLIGAASQVLGISQNEILLAFGKYWILNTGHQHYGTLMHAGGTSLKEFLLNLPNFHSRVMLIYPSITPPDFKVFTITDKELHLYYYSTRPGLTYFAEGLIVGLAESFQETISVVLLQQRVGERDPDIFKISWV
ncbi:heme NO-binding domain-containing protein [Cytophagaceae bacterium DM2B3-1]|uniref:Heme NO-binding domain-containing protein n=1 Tax=Xanthocytophaga flava TaxID=3048013 RepID=A0ABT7CD09_9BACT|nr:heme NO-binding domain-containing protein [Xanthocytophaga flavus]MDJ1470644.1 heme NO-binding domain-containing protein [Xanthocytophaga flavus]MDJ1491513.1 heme NO-binding domain-containing protein [Xanthocytophaga flavus]